MVELRGATENDLDNVYKLICELEQNNLDFNKFKDIFLSNLHDSSVHYLVAEIEGRTVGFGSVHVQKLLHHCGKVAEIQELVVSSEFQSKGVGSKIMQELKAIAVKNDCLLFEVCCNRKRERAHKFYEKVGFNRSHYKFTDYNV